MIEHWQDIAGFEGYYVVSDMGRIMRVAGWHGSKPGTIRKPSKTRYGYLSATLSRDGKEITKGLHRWVAETFLGPCPDGYEINHKNGDKTDNRVENLEWVTHARNMQHAHHDLHCYVASGSDNGRAKLGEKDIPVILELVKQGMSRRKVGKIYGVSDTAITLIVNGTNWKCVPRDCE